METQYRHESNNTIEAPLGIVGGSTFGAFSKIDMSRTVNFYVSDGWLVPWPGHKLIQSLSNTGEGRGIFASSRLRFNHLIFVIDQNVYIMDEGETIQRVGTLKSDNGDVFIDENNAGQIAFCDKKNIYIYDYNANTFSQVDTGFIPGYVTFHNTYFAAPDLTTSNADDQWRISENNNGNSWPASPSNVGQFQTKADNPVAILRMPGNTNTLIVMGSIVSVPWTDTGNLLFPYEQNTYINIDYGVLNAATIDGLENIIVWIAVNEKSAPTLMVTDGQKVDQISTDGINYLFEKLTNPTNCYGYLMRLNGHLFYYFAFPDDALSLAYDFNTKFFYNITDQNFDVHLAKKVVRFNNKHYFISKKNGSLYEMSSDFTSYYDKNNSQGEPIYNSIPRVRICPTLRLANSMPYIAQKCCFTLEQGDTSAVQYVDMNMSVDSKDFGSSQRFELNRLGNRRGIIQFRPNVRVNELTPQFRFWGKGNFVVGEGTWDYYQ